MGYKIETEYDTPPINRVVGAAKTSGRVYVPKEWTGLRVDIALMPGQIEVAE
jgi:putative transposon-encoded protein